MTLAVGWPGQWSAVFTAGADGVAIKTGQERTHLRLMPGERIRTRHALPSSPGSGDRGTRAINLWLACWYLAHILYPGRMGNRCNHC